MNSLPDEIGEFKGSKKGFAGWFSEAIWGHRFKWPFVWPLTLEFLGMAEGLLHRKKLLEKTQPEKDTAYTAPVSKELRILVFNNPRLLQIRNEFQGNEAATWEAWMQDMAGRVGDHPIDFRYLKEAMPSFNDLVERIELVRKLALEAESSRKMTQRLLFPIGPAALYEPGELSFTRDRNTFTRIGEIAYLMVSRADQHLRDELREQLTKFLDGDTPRNRLIQSLFPPPPRVRGSEKGGTYLPYKEHPAFNRMAEDLIALFRLGLPHQDALEHIRFMLPFHLYLYALETSAAWIGQDKIILVCEIPGPKMDVARRASIASRDENEAKGLEALRSYVSKRIDADEEVTELLRPDVRPDLTEHERAGELTQLLAGLFALNKEQSEALSRLPSREEVQSSLLREAEKAYRDETMAAFEGLGRAAGLIDSRGTNKKRYAPTDGLLRALVLANVQDDGRIEEADFLKLVLDRYGLVFGHREGSITVARTSPELYDESDYKRNQTRLTRRLVGLGLGNSMSDACTYITNPFVQHSLRPKTDPFPA